MNALYWLEWVGGMVGSLAAISGRDWVGLSQKMERIIKTLCCTGHGSLPSGPTSQSSCNTVGTDAHLSPSDMVIDNKDSMGCNNC